MKRASSAGRTLSWEISVPLLNNRLIVGATIKIFCFAAIGVSALASLVLAFQGDWHIIPRILLLMTATGTALIIVSLMLMALLFANRWRFRFTISEQGIRFETIDRTLCRANRLAVILGTLLGKPQAIGAGLIAQSQEVQEIKWSGKFRAVYRPASRVVILRNRWRNLMIIYCTPENYSDVAEIIRNNIARHGSESRLPAQSPLLRYLAFSAIVLLASLPVFLLADPFEIPLWMPLVLLCFALSTVWLLSVFGYVVLGCILLIVGDVVVNSFAERDSFFHAGETYSRWRLYSGDEWALLLLAAAGMVVLGIMAMRAIGGHMTSMLASDMSDMGG